MESRCIENIGLSYVFSLSPVKAIAHTNPSFVGIKKFPGRCSYKL